MDDLEKELKRIDRQIEDEAWAKKKAIYGDKFNAPKFYELSAFWPNFFWITFWIVAFTLIFAPSIIKKTKEADARLKSNVVSK